MVKYIPLPKFLIAVGILQDIIRYYIKLFTIFTIQILKYDQILDLCEERHILDAMYHNAKHIIFERDQTMV